MDLSDEEMRSLAQQERDMTSGAQAHVVCAGERWAFQAELLERLGIVSGQTVDRNMITELIKRSLARCQQEIEARKHLQ